MKNRIYRTILVIGALLLYSHYSLAECVQNPQNNLRSTASGKTITVQYDNISAIGTVLDTQYVQAFSSNYNFADSATGRVACGGYQDLYYVNGWSANASKIASTGIAGIGIRINYSTFGSNSYIPITSSNAGSGASWVMPPSGWNIQIVKTGTITSSGTLRSGEIAYITQGNSTTGTRFIGNRLSLPTNYRINVVSCSLKNSKNTYDINLGDWYDTQFKNIGDFQGTVNIPITLSCQTGTNIKYTVTSDTVDNAANGRLGLSGANKATGIAVQLLNNAGTPIQLNTKLVQQNSVPANDYIFGWKARYIKTAAIVTPGTANANATVNIRYE